ncbi:MAG: hypothetical protein M1837_005557 [Sclerophora amabilis]|nr:MAG: hypothetical protein M1837_005557 [Sclerophora amabilis]
MPPQRTVPPAKAVKTERTHEENQERAYIAASRRSDRSLEARVESARRASEIHKRRTGRSLRVTEQDVVNEEMYEEEDDDLPMQYRRLTAHLQTGSADFNRRLASYLTNHVAMRSALDQAITNSYAQHYPNAPNFANNQASMFPPPLRPEQLTSPDPSAYPPSPFPPPATPAGYPPAPPGAHGRSASLATPQDLLTGLQPPPASPSGAHAPPPDSPHRVSRPASTAGHPPQPTPTAAASPASYPQHPPPQPAAHQDLSPRAQHRAQMQRPPHLRNYPPQDPQPYMRMPYDTNAFAGNGNFSPFSMSLPPESQMMLGPALDPNDPLTSMLMAGYHDPNEPSYQKPLYAHPSYDGMSSTLAPSALDLSPNDQGSHDADPAAGSAFDLNLDFGGAQDKVKAPHLSRDESSHSATSSAPFYGEDWGAFIDDNSWDQTAT